MRFVGMGIGHQDGSTTNASTSDDMDYDPDTCEESEEYGDDKIRQRPNEDVGEGENEEYTEDEEEDQEEDQDDWDHSEDDSDIGYDNL